MDDADGFVKNISGIDLVPDRMPGSQERGDFAGPESQVALVGRNLHQHREVDEIRQVGLGNHGLLEVVEADERHVGAKAVSASFFPLEILGGLTSPGLLGDARGRVVYVAPDSTCRRSAGRTRFNQWRAVLVPRT